MFVEAIEAILLDQCQPAHVRAIEAGGSPDALWQAIESAGFLELLTPEEQGGAGLAWPELFPVLLACGRHAVPLPVAQTMASRALLGGQAAPAGRVALAGVAHAVDGGLRCEGVSFGKVAQHVLVAHGADVLLLDAAAAAVQPTGVPGSQVASLTWSAGTLKEATLARVAGLGAQVSLTSAAVHAALLAGVAARVFDLSLQYANDRVQFGRSIGKFQAVQHQLAVMAEQVAAMRVASELAFAPGSTQTTPWAVAVAKGTCSAAAAGIAAAAHAIHGAIGVTAEFDLQLFTRRLHEWRQADGSEAHWHRQMGRALLEAPPAVTVTDFARAAAQ